MQRYYLQVYGCQMNRNEAGLVRTLLSGTGRVETGDETEADIILMLTCSVRSHAEARALGRLGSFRVRRTRPGRGSVRAHPPVRNRVIAVLGCMAETASRVLVEEHGVDIVLGPDRYRLLPEAITEALAGRGPVIATGMDRECYEGIMPGVPEIGDRRAEPEVRGSVVVMRGCNNWCAYCVVPLARGPERSRSLNQITEECRVLVDRGVKDITLLGQNALAWHEDACDFTALLETVARIPGVSRLRFLTSHPRDFSTSIARAMAGIPGVCPDLHLPVQSGSDRVLELMNRGYTRTEYLDRVSAARELMPGLGLSTDFLVGFPGENEEDFLATLDLARQVRFDVAYMFRYSVRPGTASARMGPKVSEAEAGDRLARLIRLQNRITSEKAREFVGREVEVLIEARAQRGVGMLGRTRSNRTIIIGAEGPGSRATAPGKRGMESFPYGGFPARSAGAAVADCRRLPARLPAIGQTCVVRITGVRGWTPVAEIERSNHKGTEIPNPLDKEV